MKKFSTADRLQQIMSERGLKQVDILKLCEPHCNKYNIQLRKNDLSQYISGKVIPKQDKLSILGMALGVNEVWLMGYDVPADTSCEKWEQSLKENLSIDKSDILKRVEGTFGLNTAKAIELFTKLDTFDQGAALERMKMMLEADKYSIQKELRHA